MIKGKMIVQSAEIRQSKKEGVGNYGIITLIAMGVSPLDMFCSEEMVNNTVTGGEYEVDFKLKGKELSGISKMKLIK